jgi:hypothetical protein
VPGFLEDFASAPRAIRWMEAFVILKAIACLAQRDEGHDAANERDDSGRNQEDDDKRCHCISFGALPPALRAAATIILRRTRDVETVRAAIAAPPLYNAITADFCACSRNAPVGCAGGSQHIEKLHGNTTGIGTDIRRGPDRLTSAGQSSEL